VDFGPTGPITGGPAADFAQAPEPPEIDSSRRRWINAGRAATAITSSLVLAATGIAWSEYENLASGLTTSSALRGAGHSHNGAVNILLIGLDSRKDQNGNPLPHEIMDKLHAGDGNEGGYNTNTLILLHVPGNGGPAKAFSIPRDDQVPIPGEQPDKIKKAYGLAKAKAETKMRAQGVRDQATLERQSRDAGRRATLDVVRTLTGQPIDHFAEVNLAGFYDLASALGGVPVCLNHAVSDDYSGANFPAGRQVLNASQALSFVRQRHGLTNGDLDRTHRQQAFLTSVASKLRSSGTFTSPSRLQGLLNVAKKDVVIDSDWDVLSFAQQAPNLTGGNMQFQTLPIQGYGKKGGEEINLIDPVKIREIVHAAFDGAPPPKPPKPSARAMGAEGASSAQEPASTVPQSSHLLQSPPPSGPAGAPVGGADVPCVN
jgi:LCP family protein required for cell wall assembly